MLLFQIESFNNEEEAFGWDTTAYPQRGTIINQLKPYHQLYELTVEFNNKYKSVSSDQLEGLPNIGISAFLLLEGSL